MKRFQDLVQAKLSVLREDKFIADEVHSWAYLEYLMTNFKNYLMNDDGRHKSFEEDNQEILLWLSYIGALAQHSGEQLKLIPMVEGGISDADKKGKYLLIILENILSHIKSNKRPSGNPPQRGKTWYDVAFSDEHIKDLARIVKNCEENNCND